MNREEILAMEVGGELNAQIEIGIFDHAEVKWRWCWREPECGAWEEVESRGQEFVDRLIESHKGWGEELVKKLPCYREDIEFDIWDVVPFYSEDISTAWQVKERLNSEGLLLILADLRPGEALCRAEFWNSVGLPSSTIVGQATAKLTPEAICKAALLTDLLVTTKPST